MPRWLWACLSACCLAAEIDAPARASCRANRDCATPVPVKLLSLLGLDARLQRARTALDEGARAAEDRAQLLSMAWEQDKQRLKLLFALVLAVLGLAILAVAMLSAATVVHFWDTSHRITAAWSVAGFWTLSGTVALGWLWKVLQRGSTAYDPARLEFARDWEWLQARMESSENTGEPRSREARPGTPEMLQARIARQRERLDVGAHAPMPPRAAREAAGASMGLSQGETAIELARAHPVVTGIAAAGVVAILGPRRIIRWAGWLLPLLMRGR